MKFESKDPETGADNWGCPRYSKEAQLWFVDWYDAKGNHTGASMLKAEDVLYVDANPRLVAKEQAELATWLKKFH